MFTGIVEEVGRVKAITPTGMSVAAELVLQGATLGDSIAVNGTCLTLTQFDRAAFSVDIVPETWRRTNLGDLHEGSLVNLERPLLATSRLGGHIVLGHVDGTGRVEAIEPDGDAVMVRFSTAPDVARYIVEKGFIAVDGISLTVVKSWPDAFSVTLIPYTRAHTTFLTRRPGEAVNLEVDIIAKYVERFVAPAREPAARFADWRP